MHTYMYEKNLAKLQYDNWKKIGISLFVLTKLIMTI